MIVLFLLGCATKLDGEDLCAEVGYAIASRTQTCTGDGERADARYEKFADEYTCVEVDLQDEPSHPEDLYACPLAIRNLACELVETYGDDLDAWLGASPACGALVETP